MYYYEFGKIEKNVLLMRAYSALPFEEIYAKVKKLNFCIQLFDPNAILSRVHVLAAYANALEDFESKRNVGKTVAMETLMYVAFTYQIDDAIRIAGAKSPKNFLIFYDKEAEKGINALKGIRLERYVQTNAEHASALKLFGIATEQAILEAMARMKLERH